ncbi:hypothetical protein ACQ86N_38515 [Puia sp. P3]|uniref:hypothetical protein n=1 Tax=Puia sp. P3 TaxID=3423952 RepID=UPI003D674019
MSMHFRYLLTLTLVMVVGMGTKAQTDSSRRNGMTDSSRRVADTPRYRVAIFAPLYLDSAFDATGNYRYDKNFPKYFNPGLEFYEGAQLALDSLQKEKSS